MEQTAVEWLFEKINPYGLSVHESLFEQAKEMERQQIIDAYKQGIEDWNVGDLSCNTKNKSAEQYYNQTFKQE